MKDYHKLIRQLVELYEWEVIDDMLLDIIIDAIGSCEYDESDGNKRQELLFLYKQLRNAIKGIYYLRGSGEI